MQLPKIFDWGHEINTIVSEAAHRLRHTPDYSYLELHNWQRVFIADEMGFGDGYNKLLAGHSEHMGVVFTQQGFTMFKKKLGSETYPIALEDRYHTAPYARVRGNLYIVRPYQIKELDKHRMNEVHFRRKRVTVVQPYHVVGWKHGDSTFTEKRFQKMSAWMYVGIPEYWNDMLDNGYQFGNVETCVANHERIGRYYSFTEAEFENI